MKKRLLLLAILFSSSIFVVPNMGLKVDAKEEIRVVSGVTGIFADSIIKSMKESVKQEKKFVQGYITENVNIRTEPNVECEIVGTLNYGDVISYCPVNNEWVEILYGDTTMYIYSSFVTCENINYTYYDVPQNGIKSFMSYGKITSINSNQYKLQKSCYSGNYGIRQINGRYCAAVGSYFTTDVGIYFDLILENGHVIPCVLADCKDDKDTDSQNIITHDGSLAEFVVDTTKLNREINKQGDISVACDEWNSTIIGVKVYGRRIE